MSHSHAISRRSVTCSTRCWMHDASCSRGCRRVRRSTCAVMPTRWRRTCTRRCSRCLGPTRWMRCDAKGGICAMSTDVRPPSANEAIKANSRFLRGTIAEGLTRVETGALSDDDQQLTKFHGIYLQDDRDLRAERGRKRMEKAFIFMARLRVPGGVLTPHQWLAAEKVALERGNGTLRLTTRQTIQFHGIIKSNLREAIRGIHDAMLDTIAACGDVNRNVIARVNPWESGAHAEVAGLAQAIGAHLLPKSRAWHEIWIDGEKIGGGEEEEDEPIYGRTY